jgi:hypothetical protein
MLAIDSTQARSREVHADRHAQTGTSNAAASDAERGTQQRQQAAGEKERVERAHLAEHAVRLVAGGVCAGTRAAERA